MVQWLRSGIFRKTLFFIIVVALVPLIVLGGLTIRSTDEAGAEAAARSREALDAKSAEALELRARETAMALADFLYQREADLRTVALLPRSAEAYLAFYQAHRREVWSVENGQEVHQSIPLYRELAYVEPTGQEAIKIVDGRVAGAEELRDVSNPAHTLYKSETYFLEARQLSPGVVYISHVTGFYVNETEFEAGQRFTGLLRLAMPLFDAQGRLDGVAVLALDSRHLEEFTAHIVPPEGRMAAAPDPSTGNYAYVIDDLAGTIAHPVDYLQWGLAPDGRALPYATRQEELGLLPVRLDKLGFADENLASIHGRANQGEAGSIRYFWAGHDKFAAFAPIPYYGGPYQPPAGFGWVGISADQASFHRQATLVGDAIQGRVRTLTTVAFAILGLTALAVLLAAGALARTISVPVQRLTEAVQAAEQGDLEEARQRALAVRSRDELGTLAEGFRQMAAQLQETLAGLEQQLAERRRAEEALEVEHRALQESEARYRTLFDGVPVGLYRTAPGGQVMDANPALVEMLGYPDRESLLTVNAADLYADPAERARWRALMGEKGVVRDFVVQFRRYDGELMWVNNSSRVVREAEHGNASPGRVLSYEGSLEDITERKRAEEQLRKYQERLEERGQERTAALATANEQMRREMAERERAEEELREAKAAAEQANAAKSAFLASVSHELRTPLTSILGFAKIIDKRLGERIFPQVQADDARTQRAMGQVAENIKIVAAEAERLTALINDLLDLAKIEAGKVEWRAERVRVSELVDRAAVATSVLFVQKGLPLLREIPDDLPEIVGDRDRLVQVLINLFSNAIKFTDAGSVTCQARRAGGAIEVSVRDTGVGISEADQRKLFERFRQVGDTLTEKPKGTGLGLPICKEIVEHYGGHIWVESEPGRGSTFSFTLPIQAAATSGGTGRPRKAINIEGLLQQLEARRAGPASSRSNGRHTILIVDDDVHIRELLRQELHEAGYEVQEAGDGREALAQIRQKRPDLVVLDVMMPEMSGFDVAAVLKGDPQTMDLPIIILSIVEDQERGYRLGVDRYLTKPIETGVVLEEIERLLAQGVSRNKVMVVDQDASTLKTLTEALRAKGYEVVEAASGEEAIEKALRARPDMIILNAVLPQQREIVKTLRFERGLEHVLFLLFD